MFGQLQQLGLSKPDVEGTSVFKKEKLVPERLLKTYIEAAFRLQYLLESGEEFHNYANIYWKKFKKDRIF